MTDEEQDMQVYLQYKYYITVTKTGGRHPIPRPWIRFAEVRGERRYENVNTTTIQPPRQFSSVIDLNVGGRYFTTLLSTLTKDPDSMLAAMFRGRHPVSKDKDGRYFIDADGDVFSHIIEYLRFQKLPPAQMSVKVHEYAVYFGVQELSEILSAFASVDREENLEKIRSFYKDFPKIFKEIIYVIKQRKSYLRQFKVSLPPLIAADQFRDSVCCKCSNGEKIEMTEKDPDGKALRFLIEHELCKRGYKAQSGTTTCENTVFKNHKCGLIVCYFILTFYE